MNEALKVFSFFAVLCMTVFPFDISCQKILLLEKINNPRPIKYFEGDLISFKTKQYPDRWQTQKIVEYVVDQELIIMENGFVYMKDITELRSYRGWAKAISFVLTRFGAAWWVFGGIAHLYDENFDFGWDTFIIGGSAIVSGLLLKKLFYQRKHKMGRKWRLRMIDISFPENPYER